MSNLPKPDHRSKRDIKARLTTAVELLRDIEPFLERVPVKTEKAVRAFLRDYDAKEQPNA